MGICEKIAENKGCLIWFILLIILGGLAASYLVPKENIQLAWEISGTPDQYPLCYKIRPWLIIIACFLPALGAFLLCFTQLLDKYITRSILTTFCLTTGIIFLIYLLGDFADNVSDISSADNPLKTMLLFYGNQIPSVLSLILPYSLLLSIIWSLSSLSRTCEIIPMIQSGRSLIRIALPIIIFSCFISAYNIIFDYQWGPSASLYRRLTLNELNRAKAQKNQNSRPKPLVYRNDRENRIWTIYEFPPLNKPTEPFKKVHITQLLPSGRVKTDYIAETAQWDPKTKTWELKNVNVRHHPENAELEIPTFEPDTLSSLHLHFSETAWLLITPNTRVDTRSVPELITYLEEEGLNQKDRCQYRTQKHLRFAHGFSCFILALIAIPGGINLSRRASLMGVGVALALSAGMIFSFEVFPSIASAGYIPAWLGAWFPNIIFAVVGLYMFNTKITQKSFKDFFTKK